MASGLPVVATAVGGNAELIEAGRTGVLVPAAAPDALAAALLALWRDRDRARQLGESARVAAVERFSLERMVADYTALYERLLARGAMVRAMTSLRPPTVHAPLPTAPLPSAPLGGLPLQPVPPATPPGRGGDPSGDH
jgi:hypothetical protein